MNPRIRTLALHHAEDTGAEFIEEKSDHLRVVFHSRSGYLVYCYIVVDGSGYTHFVEYRRYRETSQRIPA